MKLVKLKNILTKLIITLLIITTLMGIVPNISYAETDTEEGGSIFNPLCKLVTFACDGVMDFMQRAFVSSDNIVMGDGRYKFQFSPGVIFSGNVKAFDINFIKPDEEETTTRNYDKYFESKKTDYKAMATTYPENEKLEKLNAAKSKNSEYRVFSHNYTALGLVDFTEIIYYEENGTLYIEYFNTSHSNTIENSTVDVTFSYMATQENIEDILKVADVETTYKSISSQLQPTIATWYNALKRIALVGLLSVLVYLGIRIVLASFSAQDSSKYKKMLTNWLIAICMLFTLHYIMNATIVIVENILKIFDVGTEDVLIQEVRDNIELSPSWGDALPNVVIYVLLTIYTVMFAFQYLKRVLYMGFFTLIAPIIALMYPLDKVKDGQAQAFTLWIREYIFNALIPIVHILIYFICIQSALDLVKSVPIYAVIVIGTMTQGEKIIRNMFGFNNAETIGTVELAAAGGLASSAVNMLKSLSKGKKK